MASIAMTTCDAAAPTVTTNSASAPAGVISQRLTSRWI
jgi:hypothetical protein